MSGILAQIVVLLNALANALGRLLLAPIASLPGWLSATLVAAVTGVFLLFVFKYTSNQGAIKRVRNDINANLLALKLFKDATPVVLAAQAAMIRGAFRLFVLAVVPMLVMAVPVLLLLGQLSLWYQHRPLRVGEEAVVVLKLNGEPDDSMPAVGLEPTAAVEVVTGPGARAEQARGRLGRQGAREGIHRLSFRVGDQAVTKELAIGDGFMRVSPRRPGWDWYDALLNPAEPTFPPSSPVRFDRDRLSRSAVVDQRHRLLGHLLVRRLDDRRLLRETAPERESLSILANRADQSVKPRERWGVPASNRPDGVEATMAPEIMIVSGLPRSGTSLMMPDARKRRHRRRHRQHPHARHRQPARLLRIREGQEDQGKTPRGCPRRAARRSRWSRSSSTTCPPPSATASSS